ncbi:zinc finger and BTB domain-containing protein 2-like [Polyodon spathula]|uniref:zinc finger and BTB domain-containing protein 2-like n=1 Tax=Polyodon spathula TaxID=7913 RepID=UPI001B7EE00F|nr:zinc finger and BTB domain-containing protein 2-like [Polyodon spathula]
MELANHGLILLQQLNAQREFGFLCDCTVAIGDVFFKAHKSVLAAFSNYFRMLFIHQDRDCVRLKPADIQPDIFSYLLNLMYTGKLAPQLIDPVRLEQGVKFLHAYPLLQEASLAGLGVFPHSEQLFPLATSLYGIQIADQQAGLPSRLRSPKALSSTFEPEQLLEGNLLVSESQHVQSVEEADASHANPSTAEVQSLDVPAVDENPAANTILHVKPSIMKRNSSFRKHYSCHLCSSRFNQRSTLREHLMLHSQMLFPSATSLVEASLSPMLCNSAPEPAREQEDAPKGGGDIISDGEFQRATDSPRMESLQPQAETPPPSDIADIDNLESMDLEREVKRRKYECSTCGRKFIQKSHWREHMYIHTGKPYKCSACGKSFCRANQAARHVCLNQSAESYTVVDKHSMELCSNEEGSQMDAIFLPSSRPYKCNVCDMTFVSPNEVIKHLCFAQNAQVFSVLDNQPTPQNEEPPKDKGSDSGHVITSIKTDDILAD